MLNVFWVEMTTNFAVISHSPVQLFEPAVRKPVRHFPCLASISGEQSLSIEQIIELGDKVIAVAIRLSTSLYLLDLRRCRQEANEQSTICHLNQRPKQRVSRPDQVLLVTENHNRFVVRLGKRKEGCK